MSDEGHKTEEAYKDRKRRTLRVKSSGLLDFFRSFDPQKIGGNIPEDTEIVDVKYNGFYGIVEFCLSSNNFKKFKPLTVKKRGFFQRMFNGENDR